MRDFSLEPLKGMKQRVMSVLPGMELDRTARDPVQLMLPVSKCLNADMNCQKNSMQY